MDNDTAPATSLQRLMQWVTTPPQSYGVYLVALILIFIASFYAGSLKPKHTPSPPPAATAPSAPHS
jgi:hypothetical protein